MEGIVTYLKGKDNAMREAMLSTMEEAEAALIRAALTAEDVKENKSAIATDLFKEPTIESQKAIQQSMKEISSNRESNNKLGKQVRWRHPTTRMAGIQNEGNSHVLFSTRVFFCVHCRQRTMCA